MRRTERRLKEIVAETSNIDIEFRNERETRKHKSGLRELYQDMTSNIVTCK